MPAAPVGGWRLGKSGALAAALALLLQGLPVASHASTYPSGGGAPADCTSSTGPVTVGRLSTPDTNAQPVNGMGLDSNVLGCNASGNGEVAASVFGTFSEALGAGGSVFGFNAQAEQWASAFGLETVASGIGSTALGFGSRATNVNSVAIGGAAAADGVATLPVADSTLASGFGALAIGSDGVRGAQATATGAIAIGGSSAAAGGYSIAVGERAQADFANDVAFGTDAHATGEPSGQAPATAFGNGATASKAADTAFGALATASGGQSLALGYAATASGLSSAAFGTGAEASATNALALGGFSYADGANSTAIGGASTSAKGSVAIGDMAEASAANSVALGANAIAGDAHSVALGDGSVTAAAVGTTSGTVGGTTYTYAGGNPQGTVSVGAVGGERTITNVAAGRVAGSSTDAINGSQLAATNQKVDTLQDGALLWDPTANGGAGAYSASHGGSSESRVSNVANGIASNDAVNVQQLNAGIATAQNWAKDYTDRRFAAIVDTVGKRANGGVASAMAMASLPQAYQPNQNAAAVAFGNYHGQTSVAVGLSTITESGRYVFKVNATSTTNGDTGVGMGAAVVW